MTLKTSASLSRSLAAQANKSSIPIDRGGRMNEGEERAKINQEFTALIGGGLGESEWKIVKKLKDLLDALPDGAASNCTVSILPNQMDVLNAWGAKNRAPMSRQFFRVQMRVNGQVAANGVADTDGLPATLGVVPYPLKNINGPMIFEFFRDQNHFLNQGPQNPPALSGPPMVAGAMQPWPNPKDPWQCLRYLAGNATPNPDDHKIWTVEIIQNVRGASYSLFVQFKFDRPLPTQADWPQP